MFKLNSRVFPIRSHVALLIMLIVKETCCSACELLGFEIVKLKENVHTELHALLNITKSTPLCVIRCARLVFHW